MLPASSLKALLAGAIDYAGLFPPAQLPMADAVRKYAEHRRSPHAWMLARFICPASRLDEFAASAAPHWNTDGGGEWKISVLGRGGRTFDEFLAGLAEDLAAAAAFHESFGRRESIASFELRLAPDAMNDGANRVRELFNRVHSSLAGGPFSMRPVFFEPGAPLEPGGSVSRLAYELGLCEMDRARADPRSGRWGVKIRCGGTTPEAFPAAASLASALAALGPANSAKFTAGLHHPLRHHNAGLDVRMHGFLNVLGAAALRFAGARSAAEFDQGAILAMLEDEHAADFVFTDAEFRWRSFGATTGQIAQARSRFALSFGSCSFDEPVADMRALNLL